jgi:hypothetical protein
MNKWRHQMHLLADGDTSLKRAENLKKEPKTEYIIQLITQ